MNTTKKIFTLLNVLVIAFVLSCTTFQYKVLAKKTPKQETTLTLKARDGGNIVYGSVLNPKENELKAKLPKNILNALLNSLKKGNIEEIYIILTKLIKENESSNIYTLKPADSISVFGKHLVVNVLASLTDVNGSIYSAGALPDGDYELTLRVGKLTSKGKFEYKTPVLVVGNVTTKGGKCVGGTQQVNSLQGKSISNVVALTSNCSYFNEVQASRINDKQEEKNRKHLYQSSDTTSIETTGLVLNLDASNLDNVGNSADSSDTSTTWTDRSGNSNNGTLTNFTLPTGGSASGWDGANTPANPSVLKFDGSDDYISTSAPSLNANGSFTYAIWINITSFTNGLISDGSGDYFLDRTTTTNPLVDLKPVGGQFAYQTRYDDGTGLGGPVGGIITTDKWAHIVLVRDYNVAFRLYVDGTEVATTTDTGSKALTPPALKIGSHDNSPPGSQNLAGKIGNVRIYNIALTAEQIRQNYLAEASKFQGSDTTGTEPPPFTEPPISDIEPLDTTTEEAKEIAISEAIATTSDGGIEELSAAIELDPENNGEKQFDISENTTQIVENAIDFIQGEEEVLSEEDLEFTEEILQEEVKATLVEEEAPEVEEEFVFDPTCTSKFIDLTNTISSTPTREELLDFGKRVIALIESGELKNCIPPFITKIIDRTKSKGDTGFISFAKKFIFHVKEIEGGLEGPNLNEICTQLKEGIKLFETCKGGFCPPPPCIHPNVRDTLKETCPELLALVPTSKCEEGRGACEKNGELNEEIGASCIEFESVDSPNLCEPCNSDADCINPKEVPQTNCTLAINVCRPDILDYYGDPVGKTQHQGAEGICFFNGIPKNPFTCEELAFVSDPQLICLGPPPPAFCTLDPDGSIPSLEFIDGVFDRRCCNEMGTTVGTKTTGLNPKQTPQITCVFKRICSDQDTYFHPGEFGLINGDMAHKARELCIIETNSFDESGEKIVACFNNPCPDSPLECLEQIEVINCEDPKCNLGNCDSGFIGLP